MAVHTRSYTTLILPDKKQRFKKKQPFVLLLRFGCFVSAEKARLYVYVTTLHYVHTCLHSVPVLDSNIVGCLLTPTFDILMVVKLYRSE